MKIPAQYAKFLTAIAGQALTYVQWEYGGSNKWVTLATAAAAALGVFAVPNAPSPAAQQRAVAASLPAGTDGTAGSPAATSH